MVAAFRFSIAVCLRIRNGFPLSIASARAFDSAIEAFRFQLPQHVCLTALLSPACECVRSDSGPLLYVELLFLAAVRRFSLFVDIGPPLLLANAGQCFTHLLEPKVFVCWKATCVVHYSRMERSIGVMWVSAGTSRPQMDDQPSHANTELMHSNPFHMEGHKDLEPTRIQLLWRARSE